MKTIDAAPKASVLIESMRDIGYSLETALADVVDNSITAGATRIDVQVDTEGSEPFIAVIDNGCGMTGAELQQAMRLGSRHPRESRAKHDLGRFGLGLKTASFSQCRRLTVVARQNGKTTAAIWDLDHVARSESWSLLIPESTDGIPCIEQLGPDGALVVWQRLDRALDPEGSGAARQYFVRRIAETREHLELVFHRYLGGERGTKRVTISFNNTALTPFDPFHSSHPATLHGQTEKVKIGADEVEITAFTLPHHRNVTAAEWDRFAGRAGYLKNQGFYLYREKRLIVHGTWFGLARQAELTKLTRVRVDMPNAMDSDWHVDVKKASARPPLAVRERLRRLIGEIGAPSKRIYERRGARLHDSRLPIWTRFQENNCIVYQVNQENPIIAEFYTCLPEDLKNRFTTTLKAIGAGLPMDAIFADLAGNPETVKTEALSDEALREFVGITRSKLVAAGIDKDLIPQMLRAVEPFRSNWDRAEDMLEAREGTR